MWWTLIAAAVGSGTALYIAIIVYPQQKEIDRAIEVRRERRAAYRLLIDRMVMIGRAVDRLESQSELTIAGVVESILVARSDYERELLCAAMIAPPSVVVAMVEDQRSLDRLLEAFRDTISAIQTEGGQDISEANLRQRLRGSLWDAKLALERSNQAVVNAIRKDEFKEDGDLSLTSRGR